MREQIVELVIGAVDELNEELDYDSLSNPTEGTVIFGGEDGVDSLTLVRLIVDIESRLSDELGKTVSLSDDRAMSAKRSPFRSVGSLVEYICGSLEDRHA